MTDADKTAATGRRAHATDRSGPDSTGRLAGLRADVDRAKGTVAEVRAEIATASEARRGGPVTSVGDATTKAADLRRSIEHDLAALRSRVPDTDAVATKARTIGAAVGGAVVGLAGIVAVAKRRSAAREHDERIREQAAALAREIRWLEQDGDDDGGAGAGRWLLLAATTVAAVAGGLVWQRSRASMGIDDVFGESSDDPLRPSDVTGTDVTGTVVTRSVVTRPAATRPPATRPAATGTPKPPVAD